MQTNCYEVINISKIKKNIGICALCKSENVELKESHLIPKLAYMRTKSTKRARFRAMNNIKKPLQDGEKKYMLCGECEELFSAFETKFANNFLDEYLKTNKINRKIYKEQWFLDYILSVSWRILYDDLYNHNSFFDNPCRSLYDNFEIDARNYFHSLNTDNAMSYPSCKYYVYSIDKLTKGNDNIIRLFKGTLFGYCYYDGTYMIPLIITYYLGLVIVTVIEIGDVLFIDSFKKSFRRKHFFDKIVKDIVAKELYCVAQEMSSMYKKNMTPELYNKIKQYYGKQ